MRPLHLLGGGGEAFLYRGGGEEFTNWGGEVFPSSGWRGVSFRGVARSFYLGWGSREFVFEMFVIQMRSYNYFPRGRTSPQTNGASYEEQLKLKTSSSPVGTRWTPRACRQMRKAKRNDYKTFFPVYLLYPSPRSPTPEDICVFVVAPHLKPGHVHNHELDEGKKDSQQ